MANEYKGLTIVFKGEDSQLTKVLSGIIRESRKASAEMRSIERALNFDPKGLRLLEERVKSADKAVKAATDKVDALKAALESTDDPAAIERLNRELAVAEAYLKRASEELIEFSNKASLLGRIGTAMEEQGTKISDFGKKVKGVGDNIMGVGTALTMGVTVPLTTAAAFSVKAATDIDTAWYGVRKTVDATEDKYQQLKDSAIELSKTQPVSAETLLNIEALGGQLGISTDNLEEFARVISGIDIATDLDAETAATELSRFMNITGLSQDKVSNLGSTLVDLGNHFATTESDIMLMAMRLASAGAQAGMTDADILGLSTSLSSMGMRAEAGGSALSRVINNINGAVATGSEKLSDYAAVAGMSADEFASAWRDNAANAFSDFLVGVAQVGDEAGSTQVVLDELGITEIRTSDAMRRLAGNTDLVKDAVGRANTAFGENKALTDEVNERNNSLASKFEVLKNRLTAVAEDIGRPIADALLDAADAAEPLFKTVEDVARAFSDLDRPTQTAILQWGLLAAAAGPLLTGIGGITSGVGSVIDVFGKIEGAAGKGVQGFQNIVAAATTTDKNLAKAFSVSGTTAEKLALLVNPLNNTADGVKAVGVQSQKAAGEVIQFSTAAEKIKSTGKGSESASKSVKAIGTAAKKSKDEVIQFTKAADKVKDAGKGANETAQNVGSIGVAANQSSGKLVSFGGIAKGVITSIGSALAGAGITALVGLAIGAAVTAISDLIAKEKEAKEYADLMKRSHDDLAAAVDGATTSIGEASDAIEDLSAGSDSVREQIKAVAEDEERLAQSIKESNAEVQQQNSQLYDAYSVIQQYANQSGLTADEQLRFKDAIEKVNEACGTNYEVVDAANGRFADGNGVIQENTDQLKKNIEQRLKLNKIESMQDNLAEISKNKADAVAALTKAESNLTSVKQEQGEKVAAAQRAYDEAVERYGKTSQQATDKMAVLTEAQRRSNEAVGEAEGLVNDAKDKVNEYAKAAQTAEQNLKAFTEASEGMKEGVAGMAMASDDLLSACNEMGVSLEDVADKLGYVGLSEEDFAKLTPDVLAEIAASYDGTFGSVATVLEEHNVALDETAKKNAETADAIISRMKEVGPQLDGVFKAHNIDIEKFAQKLAEAGGSVDDFANITGADMVQMAEQFSGNIDTMVWAIQHYNSVPMEDKDGTVTVDDAELVDAQGRVVVWNGTAFVDKESKAEVADGDLVDAQGRVWTWNGTELKPKTTTAKANGNIPDGSAAPKVWDIKRAIDALRDKTITITQYEKIQRSVVSNNANPIGGNRRDAKGGYVSLHAEGGIVNKPDAGVYIGTDPYGVSHIAGEAGAEAIIPLTNKRYAMPFVKMIAQQLNAMPANNIEVHPTPMVTNNFNTKVVRSGSDLDSAVQVINRAGMSAAMEVFR